MTLSFIMALAITLVAVCISINSSEEIAYLAASISLVCLILSLVFAPLPLQLLLLMFALFSTRLLTPPTKVLEEVEEVEEDKKLQLIYRGFTYERSPSTDAMTQKEISTANYLEKAPLLSSSLNAEVPPIKNPITRIGRAFLSQKLP